MDRWLGDGGMAIIEAIGASLDAYGCAEDGRGWVTGSWTPSALACNPHGVVQAGVHSVLLDAAMNFAGNAGLDGRDRSQATLEMKTETMRAARAGGTLEVRGAGGRMGRQGAHVAAAGPGAAGPPA